MYLLLLSRDLNAVSVFIAPGSTIAFIPTAGDLYDDPYFVNQDRETLKKWGYIISDIGLTYEEREISKKVLTESDAIFVAGGNTFYLLYQLQKSGIFEFFYELIKKGKPYIGTSAGAVIIGPSIDPIKMLDDPTVVPSNIDTSGLCLVDFIVLPHYGKEKYISKYETIIQDFSSRYTMVTLRDDEYIIIDDQNPKPSIQKIDL